MDLKQHLQYPFQDHNWVQKMLIGSLICLIPGMNLLVLGYGIACLRSGMRGWNSLPDWHDWRDYLFEGLSAFAILLIYMLVPIGLGIALGVIPVLGTILTAIIALIVGLIAPLSLAAYAAHHEAADAFRINELLKQLGRIIESYLVVYVCEILALSIGLAIILALPYLAFIGAFLIFYSTLVFFNILGHILR